MPQDIPNPAKTAHQPIRHEVAPYVTTIGWPLYLMWFNGSILFGFFGGFAVVTSLQDGQPLHDDFWIFAGSCVAGTIAFVILVVHLMNRRKNRPPALVFDETTVTIRHRQHVFNFGMLEFVLWDQDFRTSSTEKRNKKIRTKIIVGYRKGDHFEDGPVETFVFDAWTTSAEMQALQEMYLGIMILVKSRRKFQRDNKVAAQEFTQNEDIEGLALLAGQLKSSSIIEAAKLEDSADPRDKISMVYGKGDDKALHPVVSTVVATLDSKPVNFLSNVFIGFIGLILTVMNLAFLWALLR